MFYYKCFYSLVSTKDGASMNNRPTIRALSLWFVTCVRQEEDRQQVQQMLQQGVIWPLQSPGTVVMVMVQNKDGTSQLRWYRLLLAETVHYQGLPPTILHRYNILEALI